MKSRMNTYMYRRHVLIRMYIANRLSRPSGKYVCVMKYKGAKKHDRHEDTIRRVIISVNKTRGSDKTSPRHKSPINTSTSHMMLIVLYIESIDMGLQKNASRFLKTRCLDYVAMSLTG